MMKVRAKETVIIDGGGPFRGILVAQLLAGVEYDIDIENGRMHHGNSMSGVNVDDINELIEKGVIEVLED